MIKQVFYIKNYWKVIVFWNIDYNFFDDIDSELRKISLTESAIEKVRKTMKSGEAKAVTCNHHHTSVVLFNQHNSIADYISSIVHEAEHIKQAILKAYRIEDKGEDPAYTIGYIVKRMWEVFSKLL